MPRAMRVDRLLSEHGIGQDSAARRQEFERQKLLAALGEPCRKTEWPAAAPFLPRRAICNLENLPRGQNTALATERRLLGAPSSNLERFIPWWGRARGGS
jgi:hypothetical protein